MSFYKHGEVLISNIKEFNKYFGFQMPEDYIRFLFFTNGGRFDFEDEHSIILDEVGIEIWPDVLYGNTTSYRGNLIFWNDMYGDEIPENALIIGDTQNHGFLVYVCSGDNKGVYYWDDCLSIEGSSDKRNAYLIAGTFDEFFFKTQITREEFYNENGTSDIEQRIGENNILHRTPDGKNLQAIDAKIYKEFTHCFDNFAICDEAEASDGKVFEDLYMDLHADMVAVCLDFVGYKADKIYIYASAEGRVTSANHFYEIDGMVLRSGTLNKVSDEYDISPRMQWWVLDELTECLDDIIKLCEEHDRPMPTEIKMIYNVKKNSLETKYQYEPVYSNHKTNTAGVMFDKWYEQVKKETEKE